MGQYHVFEGKHREDFDDLTTAVIYAELARQLSYAADAAVNGPIEASNRNRTVDDVIQESLTDEFSKKEKFRNFVRNCGQGWDVELLQKFYHHLKTPLRLIQRQLAESLHDTHFNTDKYLHEAFFHNDKSSVDDLINAVYPQPSGAGGW